MIQFQHVYAANHPELAQSYFGSITAWQHRGRIMASTLTAEANLTCPDAGTVFPCHLAPWGYQSYDQTRWNYFNGMYAVMPFINHWEYTRNKTFAKEFTLPLLSGFTAFWNCFLTKDTDGVLHDNTTSTAAGPDSCFEGGNCTDPMITLALLKRIASVQLSLTKELGLGPSHAPPSYLASMIEHLAPLPTAKLAAPTGGDDNDASYAWVSGKHGAIGSNAPSVPIGVNESAKGVSGPCLPCFPVFPAELVDPRNASAEIYAIANNSAWAYTKDMKGFGSGKNEDNKLFLMADKECSHL